MRAFIVDMLRCKVSVEQQSEKAGWQLGRRAQSRVTSKHPRGCWEHGFEGDRIIELNGLQIDEWDDFKSAWTTAKQPATLDIMEGLQVDTVCSRHLDHFWF